MTDDELFDEARDLAERICAAEESPDPKAWDEVPEGWAIDLARIIRRLGREGYGER